MQTKHDPIISSVKMRAREHRGLISVTVGGKKFKVPGTVRMVAGGDFVYLSIPSTTGVFRKNGRNLEPVAMDAGDREAAVTELTRAVKTAKPATTSKALSMPEELQRALARLPQGYRVGYGQDGQLRLIKTRARKQA